ncbi:MAG: hypothetical protein LBB88_05050 [Planctomycetaceae bacterium]|jgi:predicted nuclease with TOPRIM domain|nr:hypothetical protein [Planctomycetaceae bacterium]
MGRIKCKNETRLENKLLNCQKKLEEAIKEKSRLSKKANKLKKLSAEIEQEKKRRKKNDNIDFSDQQINGYKCPKRLENLVDRLVVNGGYSWHMSIQIIKIINEEFDMQLPEIPF